MTQEASVEQPKLNPQRYQRIASHRFDTYPKAKAAAVENFQKLLSNLGKTQDSTDLTSPDYKVRVKRRVGEGREHFDVVCYASLNLFKVVEKKLEAVQAEPDATPAVEQPREKAKDRRAREQKKS